MGLIIEFNVEFKGRLWYRVFSYAVFRVSRALLSYFWPTMGVYIYTFRIKFLYGVLKVLKLNICVGYKRGWLRISFQISKNTSSFFVKTIIWNSLLFPYLIRKFTFLNYIFLSRTTIYIITQTHLLYLLPSCLEWNGLTLTWILFLEKSNVHCLHSCFNRSPHLSKTSKEFKKLKEDLWKLICEGCYSVQWYL